MVDHIEEIFVHESAIAPILVEEKGGFWVKREKTVSGGSHRLRSVKQLLLAVLQRPLTAKRSRPGAKLVSGR